MISDGATAGFLTSSSDIPLERSGIKGCQQHSHSSTSGCGIARLGLTVNDCLGSVPLSAKGMACEATAPFMMLMHANHRTEHRRATNDRKVGSVQSISKTLMFDK